MSFIGDSSKKVTNHFDKFCDIFIKLQPENCQTTKILKWVTYLFFPIETFQKFKIHLFCNDLFGNHDMKAGKGV